MPLWGQIDNMVHEFINYRKFNFHPKLACDAKNKPSLT